MNTTFTFNLPKDLKREFNVITFNLQTTMADEVREMIATYVKQHRTEKA